MLTAFSVSTDSPVETLLVTILSCGYVNRIKLIKRKMYGRANFDLLRARVLAGR